VRVSALCSLSRPWEPVSCHDQGCRTTNRSAPRRSTEDLADLDEGSRPRQRSVRATSCNSRNQTARTPLSPGACRSTTVAFNSIAPSDESAQARATTKREAQKMRGDRAQKSLNCGRASSRPSVRLPSGTGLLCRTRTVPGFQADGIYCLASKSSSSIVITTP
jgi:hypothetical protein